MNGIPDVSHVAFNRQFPAIRVYGDAIFPVTFNLKIHLSPNRACATDVQRAGHLGSVSLQVLMYWAEATLANSVFLDASTELGNNLYYSTENNVIMTPGNPDDFMITRVLHSKISALTRNNMLVGQMVLSSSDTDNTERFWMGDEYGLPGIEYLGGESLHKTPWWERPGLDTTDLLLEEVSAEELEEIKNTPDPLLEYEQELLNELDSGEAEIIDNLWGQ